MNIYSKRTEPILPVDAGMNVQGIVCSPEFREGCLEPGEE